MKVGDITAVLEAFAPLSIQESWDNSGLIIGSPEDEVHGVLVGFDCTSALIDEAVAKGCDMVVTHHPLIFKGVRRIDSKDPVGAAIMQAIRKGVAVYAAHTTADKVITGVSGAMARRLELKNVSIMVPEEDGTVGLGCIGEFPAPMTGQEALRYVQQKFGLRVIKSSKPLETPITRVALLGGSGGGEEGTIDARQWLEAVQNGTEPLVKPEQALVVTKILDAIYQSSKEGKEIKF